MVHLETLSQSIKVNFQCSKNENLYNENFRYIFYSFISTHARLTIFNHHLCYSSHRERETDRQTDMHSRSLYANTHIYNLAFTHSNNTDKQCLSNQPRRSVARGLTGFPINVSLSNQKPFYVKGLQLFTVKVTLDLLNVEAIRQSSSSFRVPCFIHKRTSNSNSLSLSLITIKFTLNSNP